MADNLWPQKEMWNCQKILPNPSFSQKEIWKLSKILLLSDSVRGKCRTSSTPSFRAVASLAAPAGQEFHFPHFSSNFDQFFLFFLKLYLFSSSFWPSGWASRPPGKTLTTPLPSFKKKCKNYLRFFHSQIRRKCTNCERYLPHPISEKECRNGSKIPRKIHPTPRFRQKCRNCEIVQHSTYLQRLTSKHYCCHFDAIQIRLSW